MPWQPGAHNKGSCSLLEVRELAFHVKGSKGDHEVRMNLNTFILPQNTARKTQKTCTRLARMAICLRRTAAICKNGPLSHRSSGRNVGSQGEGVKASESLKRIRSMADLFISFRRFPISPVGIKPCRIGAARVVNSARAKFLVGVTGTR